MQIKKGFRKIVIVPKLCPFVIKLPRMYLFKVVKDFYDLGLKDSCEVIFRYPVMSPHQWLFKGWKETLREFYLYLITKDDRLMPTYFSFFGLFNIQKRGYKSGIYPAKLDLDDFNKKGNDHQEIKADDFYDGKLVDYGGKKACKYFKNKG